IKPEGKRNKGGGWREDKSARSVAIRDGGVLGSEGGRQSQPHTRAETPEKAPIPPAHCLRRSSAGRGPGQCPLQSMVREQGREGPAPLAAAEWESQPAEPPERR